jgi:hypothetical protein
LLAQDIAAELEALGAHRYGDEVMYNPRSGEQVPCAIFLCPTYYQRLKHMVEDKVHCLTAEHDVLTSKGWKHIADVSAADEIATLDAHGELVYASPIELLHYPRYKGRMYRVAFNSGASGVDLDVTAGHRMYVRRAGDEDFGLHVVEDVGAGASYKRNALWTAPDLDLFFDGDGKRMDAWIFAAGVWVAWGDLPEDGIGPEVPQHVRAAVHAALGVLGGSPIARWLEGEPGAMAPRDVRRLPSWAWRLSARQATSFLAATMLGVSDATGFHTASEGLAGDLSRLALHAGGSADVRPYCSAAVTADGMPTGPAVWRVTFARRGGRGNEPTAVDTPASRDGFEGPVYCMTVRGPGVFYTRCNGRPAWTGNSRAANGPVVLLTRQPAEGRARDGGLRLGEMELECLWAHGSMYFLKERFMECSDNYRVFVCKKCGIMATVNPERGIYFCKACKNITEFSEVRVPYTSKLLLQEIQTMSIGARFIT